MTEPGQDNRVRFPNREGSGHVSVSCSSAGSAPSLDTPLTPKNAPAGDGPEVVEGKDGQKFVLIDRGDGFKFRVSIPRT